MTTSINRFSARAKANNKQRITLFVNPSIAKHARAQAVLDEVSLTTFVEKALLAFLPVETIIKKADISQSSDLEIK